MNQFSTLGRRITNGFALLAMTVLLLASVTATYGQTSFGRISGTVSDAAGAAVPNASVTISDPATNFTRTVNTDDSGFYTVTNLPVGTYSVSVEMASFKKSNLQGNIVNADGRLTVDIALEAGQITEVVEVTQTSGETVNTTSGEVGKVIDSQQLGNLALNGRNYYQLLSIVPGAVVTADDALDTNLATNTININGNRGVSNNLTIDGGNNNQAGSNASQINNVGIDFIQEVKLQTSNFSAEYGRNSGAQINVITKRGGNKIRGSVFEFLRNDRFDARGAFDAVQPSLRYHNYGFTVGGPMPFFNFGENDGPFFKSGKDKFFFFGGMEWKTIHRSGASNTQTLPTSAELNGDYSRRLTNSVTIPNGGGVVNGFLRDPLFTVTPESQYVNNANFPVNSIVACGLVRVPGSGTTSQAVLPVRTACFANNTIPVNRITTDGRAIANVYRTMIGFSSRYIDSPVGNNVTFQVPLTSDFRQEFIRLDYIINEKHSVFTRYIHDTNEVIDPYGTFINSSLPTATQLRNRPGNGLQTGYIYNIKPNLINELKFNASWSDQVVSPSTPYSFREAYGYAFPQLFPNGGQYENSIPNTTVSGTGAVASFSGVAATLTALTRDYTLIDNLTWVKGSHTVKFGGYYNFNQTFQNGRSLYAGTVTYNGNATNANSTGQAFGDALLGNFSNYSEASYDPSSRFRFKQYEAFVNDSWKVTKKLSLELGVRYQYGTPFYAAENTVANFDPAYYDFANQVTVNAAGSVVTVPPGARRFNGIVIPANGIPSQYQASVPSANSPAVLTTPTGAPRGFYEPKHYFMPRFGFAYSPFDDGKTAIRGGFGFYVDRIEGNVIFPLENNPPFVDSASYNNGNLSNIRGGSAAALAPLGAITTIDPNMEASSTMNFSLGVQRELPWGIFVEANGVGNLGRHLTRQQDINALSFQQQLANAASPTPLTNINSLRRYKGYTNINQRTSDATSHYYALQLYAAKRKGDLLATVNYTWSKVLTDANVLTEAAEDGLYNRRFNYGPATFDRRHIFVATYTYALPFFRNGNGWAKTFLGGFEISGITRAQAGRPYTITAASNIGNQGSTRRAELIQGVDLYLTDPNNDRVYLNPAAFGPAPAGRGGSSGVGIVTGPVLFVNDFSARKRFRFNERMGLRLQGDVFNAFNRNNFSNLATVSTVPTTFGRFTTSGPGRSIQLGIKFEF